MRTFGGKVRLEDKLASGGMGDVYRGKHLVTGADVAVKVLEPQAHPDEDVVERFRTEAHVSALLAHRNIVRVFDLFDEPDGSHALVMELLTGQTLEQRLAREKALDPLVAIAIAVPVLVALDHAHAVGVVHRDVKPANIFLSVEPDGRVTPKLLDFGVAKSAASNVKTMDGRVLGTASYVSPEQARGAADLDGRSDVFSVAVVLWEAMTGDPLFAGKDATAIMKNVLESAVDPDERIPPRVWLVIEKALAKSAYERHATAGAFARALETACGKNSDELASLLGDERPPLPKLQTPVVAIRNAPTKRSARRAWPLAVLACGAVAVIASLTLHRRASQAPIVAAATPPATTSTKPPDENASSASAAASASAPPHVHVTPQRPKRVATTPGF